MYQHMGPWLVCFALAPNEIPGDVQFAFIAQPQMFRTLWYFRNIISLIDASFQLDMHKTTLITLTHSYFTSFE